MLTPGSKQMKMKWNSLASGVACATLLALAYSSGARANVLIDTDFGSGELQLFYGTTGVASLKGFYVLPSGTSDASDAAAASGMEFVSPPPAGAGSADLLVQYRLRNITGAAFPAIKFIAAVNPDGDTVDFRDVPEVHMVAGLGEPSQFGVDQFSLLGGLSADISAGQLDGGNHCGTPCDVFFALQWEIPSLQPGDTAVVTVKLGDNLLGSPLSQSFLAARQANAAGEIVDPVDNFLRFSGTVSIVPIPEPETWTMLLAGLGLLAFLRYRNA